MSQAMSLRGEGGEEYKGMCSQSEFSLMFCKNYYNFVLLLFLALISLLRALCTSIGSIPEKDIWPKAPNPRFFVVVFLPFRCLGLSDC